MMAASAIRCRDLAALGIVALIFECTALNLDEMRALAARGIPRADVSANRKYTRSQAWLKQGFDKAAGA